MSGQNSNRTEKLLDQSEEDECVSEGRKRKVVAESLPKNQKEKEAWL